MKNSNYLVNRNDILVGHVIKTIDKDKKILPGPKYKRHKRINLLSLTDKDIERDFECCPWLLEQKPYIEFHGSIKMWERSMLFVLEKGWSNDLLYDSPTYPICNISSIDDWLKARITVTDEIYKIGRVLEYLGYPAKITLEDVINIKETLFSVDWIIENSCLFGVYETSSNESANHLFDSQHRNRSFNDWRDDGPIPERYFWAFYFNKQHRLADGINEREDFFEPGPNEGRIRRLY